MHNMQCKIGRIIALAAVAVMVMGLTIPVPAGARAATADEATVKAGYLFNFMKFVNWPSNAQSPQLIVCVLGSNPFGNVIETLNGREIRSSRIRVVTDVPLEQTKYCHVVFVSKSESGRLTPTLLRLRQMPILTVSDIAGFTDKGGVIELFTSQNGDVAFRVSQQSAEAVGLRVSSKLLSLSR